MPKPVNIWILVVGEPLPLDGPDERLLRAGLLAARLVARGHNVTWWTSAFDHRRKRFRAHPETIVRDGIVFQLLKGSGYRRNVSLQRVRDQREVAREFARRATLEKELPDILFVAYPTVELADAAESYAARIGRPLVVDIRDLWPDIFADVLPPFLRGLGRLALKGMTRQSAKVLGRATAISGITESFVDWGVARAGRARGANDRAFPLAYDQTPLSSQDLLAAAESLRIRGMNLRNGRARVVFTGSLGKQFDFETVFEAADRVRDLPIDFVIAGSGESESALRQRAATLSNVQMTGWLSRGELEALLNHAVLGLAPYRSTWDFEASIPNKVIEYLASGLPVISSLRGEVAAMLSSEDCGVTYAVDNAGSLASALRNILLDRTRLDTMTQNARDLFKRRFSGRDVYPAMSAYLEGMAETGRSIRP